MTTEKKEKAIILCGGLGTRLREVIGEKQKTMASVKGEPFLKIVVEYLKKEGINDIIFACEYKKEEIIAPTNKTQKAKGLCQQTHILEIAIVIDIVGKGCNRDGKGEKTTPPFQISL